MWVGWLHGNSERLGPRLWGTYSQIASLDHAHGSMTKCIPDLIIIPGQMRSFWEEIDLEIGAQALTGRYSSRLSHQMAQHSSGKLVFLPSMGSIRTQELLAHELYAFGINIAPEKRCNGHNQPKGNNYAEAGNPEARGYKAHIQGMNNPSWRLGCRI